MKKYIKSRIIMAIETIIVISLIFFLKRETFVVSTFSVASNTSFEKPLD